MRNIILTIGLILGVTGAYAQGTATSTAAAKIEVKDYKSFQAYVAAEQAALKNPPLTTDTGPVKQVLKKLGLEFGPNEEWARAKDRKRTAFISPDKKGVLVIDTTTRRINIYNPKGKIARTLPIPKNKENRNSGVLGYSDTRMFDFKLNGFDYTGRGFDVYDLSGNLVEEVRGDWSEETYIVSNNQKQLAVTALLLKDHSGLFLLFDMDGKELWQRNTDMGEGSQLQFSPDDNFLALKMPKYWIARDKKYGFRKLYVFKVSDGRLISEEDYTE